MAVLAPFYPERYTDPVCVGDSVTVTVTVTEMEKRCLHGGLTTGRHSQTTADATKFYEAKVTELAVNLKDLEAIVAQKGSNLQILEDALRERVRTAK